MSDKPDISTPLNFMNWQERRMAELAQERDKLMEEVAMLRELVGTAPLWNGTEGQISKWTANAKQALSSATSADEWLAGKIKEARLDQIYQCEKYNGVELTALTKQLGGE